MIILGEQTFAVLLIWKLKVLLTAILALCFD